MEEPRPMLNALSLKRLGTCHPDLQRLVEAASSDLGLLVLCGHRTKEAQDLAFKTGNSELPWPRSRHNTSPSGAVDLAPWPIDWKDLGRFRYLAAVIKAHAKTLGIEVVWGGDWKEFKDLSHFELKKPK